MHLVFIGYGDIAARVAARHPSQAIWALARRLAPMPDGHTAGWHAQAFDLDTDPAPALPANTVWLYFAPPPAQGTEDSRLRRWLATADNQPRPAQLIYASTTRALASTRAALRVSSSASPGPAPTSVTRPHSEGERAAVTGASG